MREHSRGMVHATLLAIGATRTPLRQVHDDEPDETERWVVVVE